MPERCTHPYGSCVEIGRRMEGGYVVIVYRCSACGGVFEEYS